MPKTKENELTTQKQLATEVIRAGTSLFFDVAKFEHAQRVAQVFASSTMVPEQFRQNLGNCIIALNLADRMNTDPFMLMQNMYIIHGKPGVEAKLAIALVNNLGKFSLLQYKYNKDKTNCYAYANRVDTGEECRGVTVSMQMAEDEKWSTKPGSKWKTMPELMLMYRSAMFFARAYCPEALLGMQSKEELYDVIDKQPRYTAERLENDVKEHANQETIDIKQPEQEQKHEQKHEQDIQEGLEMSEEEKAEIEAEESGRNEHQKDMPGF